MNLFWTAGTRINSRLPTLVFGKRQLERVFTGFPADRYIVWQPDRRFGVARS